MVRQKEIHKLFKQALITRRYVTEELAAVLWKKCELAAKSLNDEIELQFEAAEVGTYIQEINDTLTPLSIEFKSRMDEISGKRIWALVNTVDGEIAQIATDYTAVELAYFKQLIEMMVLAPANAYAVSSLAALREVNTMKPTMSKTQAETALSSFVANGWLYKSERGRYGLSARSLIELELYLRRTYPDEVVECNLCNDICTIGIACEASETDECAAVAHRHCYDIYKRAHSKCPVCEGDWTRQKAIRFFGEEFAPDGFDDSRRRRRREEEEEDSDMEQPPPTLQPPTQVKRGKLVKRSQMTQGEDDDDE